jgi:hypothetical protein
MAPGDGVKDATVPGALESFAATVAKNKWDRTAELELQRACRTFFAGLDGRSIGPKPEKSRAVRACSRSLRGRIDHDGCQLGRRRKSAEKGHDACCGAERISYTAGS